MKPEHTWFARVGLLLRQIIDVSGPMLADRGGVSLMLERPAATRVASVNAMVIEPADGASQMPCVVKNWHLS